jgi:prolipoprotein diacylglyceryltransferase
MPRPEHAALIHAGFEWAAMLIGARWYMAERRYPSVIDALTPGNFGVLVGCLFGAALGNKAVFWVQYPHLWDAGAGVLQVFRGGQSMVGGLLGGLLGVELAKRLTGIRRSTGDAFVFPILAGLIVGRIGCFIAGLHDDTYGVATTLSWGIDFGDGIRRHPTQLYEIVFAVLLWTWLDRIRAGLARTPGLLFKLMLVAYLLWRLLVDAIKPVPFPYPAGLSGIQWVCVVALLLYSPLLLRQWRLAHRLVRE